MKLLYSLLLYCIATLCLSGCFDKMALAESSFGKVDDKNSRASPTSVISMGRDDDDGKAKKWHIGGGED
jgi:hypothetical protein